jgi:putative peptidoglycan lipid II flippase
VVTGGALSSAFIPVFTSYAVGEKDEKTAWHITSSALNLAAVGMIVLAGIAALLAPVLVPLYNVNVPPQEMGLIITLTRIMLLQAVVLGSGVIVGAVLNARQDFTHTAIGTVLYNVGLILGLLPGFIMTFHSGTHNPLDAAVYSATWGVVLAAILQVGAQIPGLPKIGMHYRFVFDWRHPGIRRIATQMIPRIINSVMLSFSTAVDRFWLTSLAAILPRQPGLVTEYFQAFSIFLMPVSIFGSAVSTAAFPTLASYVAQRRFDRVRSILLETLRGILFLAIPSSVGLMVLAFPIIQVLLHFDLQGAQNTSISLFFFALGLPALAAVEILTRSFYALQDSKTPVVISVAQFLFKIVLSVFLLNLKVFGPQWGMGGLALSTSVAGMLEALVLFALLYRRIGNFDFRALIVFLCRVLLAVGIMAVVLVFLRLMLDHLIDTTRMPLAFPGVMGALIKLLIELGVGAAVFLAVARFQNMEETNTGLVRRVINLLRIPWL